MKAQNLPGEFKHESTEDSNSLINILNEIIMGLKEKELCFGTNSEAVILIPNEKILLSVKIKKKENGKCKIVIKLEWKKSTDISPDDLVIEAV